MRKRRGGGGGEGARGEEEEEENVLYRSPSPSQELEQGGYRPLQF